MILERQISIKKLTPSQKNVKYKTLQNIFLNMTGSNFSRLIHYTRMTFD